MRYPHVADERHEIPRTLPALGQVGETQSAQLIQPDISWPIAIGDEYDKPAVERYGGIRLGAGEIGQACELSVCEWILRDSFRGHAPPAGPPAYGKRSREEHACPECEPQTPGATRYSRRLRDAMVRGAVGDCEPDVTDIPQPILAVLG